MSRTGTFRYVAFADVDAMHRAGWMVTADLGPSHGQYAVLMWRCDCEPMICGEPEMMGVQ